MPDCRRLASTALVLVAAVTPAFAQTRIGDEFQITNYTLGVHMHPSTVVDGNGNFAVVWRGSGTKGSAILGRRFTSVGVPGGPGGQVSSGTSVAGEVQAASDGQSRFVVVWERPVALGSYQIVARRFDLNGPVGSELQVSNTTGFIHHPAVAVEGDGKFVVVWDSVGQDGSYAGVVGRRFDFSTGTPLGTEFQVNIYTTN